MKFGDYLRQQREQKNWQQPEAAQRASIAKRLKFIYELSA